MGSCFSTGAPSGALDPSVHSKAAPTKWKSAANDVLPACEPLRLLGEGTFGTVVLVRERCSGQLYAAKVMNKSQLVNEEQLDNIIVERQVLREAGPHPFVVECHSGFQTADAVVLVLEYVRGGDMFDLMKKHGCLSEDDARFYLAEIVVAVKELHRHNFVFRDLKLENILIDERGHVRLTDFGLAGKLGSSDDPIFDISGTAIYQAPELLGGTGHGRVVDWWALGVLAYVLIAGRPPFQGDSRSQLYEKILNEKVDLNNPRLSALSDVGKDFLAMLLDKNPNTRLGSAGRDAKDVQEHPFFAEIDWKAVEASELQPPLSPALQGGVEGNADDVKRAESKLRDKVTKRHSKFGKAVLDSSEYIPVRVNSSGRRISIGLDFNGQNTQAAEKTWTGTANDFGRVVTV